MRWTAASASLPAISNLAHVADVEQPRPRPHRHVLVTMTPEYSTGMSQPPNGTILAPEVR